MIKTEICEEKKKQITWEKAKDRLYRQAENERKITLLVESKSIRKRGLEFSEYLQGSKEKVLKLEDKLKHL